jgi:hypothetical protein
LRQRIGQPRCAADAQLRLGRTREQRWDVMAEAAQPQIDLSQPIEEEQPRLYYRMRELALDEFER